MTKIKLDIKPLIVKEQRRRAHDQLEGRKPSIIEKDIERKEDKYRKKIHELVEDETDNAPFFTWEEEDERAKDSEQHV